MKAADKGFTATVKLLVDAGANKDLKNYVRENEGRRGFGKERVVDL